MINDRQLSGWQLYRVFNTLEIGQKYLHKCVGLATHRIRTECHRRQLQCNIITVSLTACVCICVCVGLFVFVFVFPFASAKNVETFK